MSGRVGTLQAALASVLNVPNHRGAQRCLLTMTEKSAHPQGLTRRLLAIDQGESGRQGCNYRYQYMPVTRNLGALCWNKPGPWFKTAKELILVDLSIHWRQLGPARWDCRIPGSKMMSEKIMTAPKAGPIDEVENGWQEPFSPCSLAQVRADHCRQSHPVCAFSDDCQPACHDTANDFWWLRGADSLAC